MDRHLKRLTDKKRLLDKHRPLAPELVKNLEDWYRVELAYTSNAIEGNTLSRHETELVVEKGLTVKGKTLVEHLEAANHAEALDFIKGLVDGRRQDITERDIRSIHKVILQRIDDPSAGVYRNVLVRATGSEAVFPNHIKVPLLMREFVEWLCGGSEDHIAKIAADAHVKLASIHPFVDGNGRVSRLLMNLILMQEGYPPAIIRKEDRLDYVEALEKGQVKGEREGFYGIVCNSVERSLDIYLEAVGEKKVESKSAYEILRDSEGQESYVKVGELSKLSGVRLSTLKYHSQLGILPFEQEGRGLAKRYHRDRAMKRLEKIKGLKEKGYSVDELVEYFGKKGASSQ